MHIALVVVHLGEGGAESTILSLARSLASRGHSVDIVLLYSRLASAYEVPRNVNLLVLQEKHFTHYRDVFRIGAHFGVRLLPHLRPRHISQARSISEYLHVRRPDVLIPSLASPKVASLLAIALSTHHPLIVPIVHNNIRHRKRRYRALYRALLAHADRIVAVSDGVAESLTSCISIPPSRITRIYNPVVSERLHSLSKEIPPHDWLKTNETPIILAAGRFDPVKDFETLLNAFELLTRKRKARLILLGDGCQRSWLQDLVSEKQIDSIVSLPGWVANPYAFMSRASVFVLSSKFEGLGNVLVEALACGCPSISTDCPSGPREILDHGLIGPLVPVGDHVALAEAINRLLNSPPETATLRSRAQAFSVASSVDQYERLLLELMASRSS